MAINDVMARIFEEMVNNQFKEALAPPSASQSIVEGEWDWMENNTNSIEELLRQLREKPPQRTLMTPELRGIISDPAQAGQFPPEMTEAARRYDVQQSQPTFDWPNGLLGSQSGATTFPMGDVEKLGDPVPFNDAESSGIPDFNPGLVFDVTYDPSGNEMGPSVEEREKSGLRAFLDSGGFSDPTSLLAEASPKVSNKELEDYRKQQQQQRQGLPDSPLNRILQRFGGLGQGAARAINPLAQLVGGVTKDLLGPIQRQAAKGGLAGIAPEYQAGLFKHRELLNDQMASLGTQGSSNIRDSQYLERFNARITAAKAETPDPNLSGDALDQWNQNKAAKIKELEATKNAFLGAINSAGRYYTKEMADGSVMLVDKISQENIGHIVTPDQAREAEVAKGFNLLLVDAKTTLPEMQEKTQLLMSRYEELLRHPGLAAATAKSGDITKFVKGSDGYNFIKLAEQVQGGEFLEAVGALKGTGPVTDYEGGKAETSRTLVVQFGQSEKQYRQEILNAMNFWRNSLRKVRRFSEGDFTARADALEWIDTWDRINNPERFEADKPRAMNELLEGQ